MKTCPRCDADLNDYATGCNCGWQDRKPRDRDTPSVIIACAHDGCIANAVCRIQTTTGMAALCKAHYDRYYLENARRTCEALGLDITAKKREYALDTIRKLSRNLSVDLPIREPGEDEDFEYIQT